ncbi:MAG: tetratricopeptide repeat protein, partial [Deltaproteobacteria bacterium]
MNEAVRLKPDNVDLLKLLVSVYREAKKYADGISVMEKAIKISPKDPELYFQLGVLYDDSRMEDKVVEAMYKVLDIDAGHANALNYIGYTYAERGIKLDEAERLVKKALEIKPDSGHIMDSLGWVYYKRGEFGKAVVELEKATRLLPEDPIVMEHLGDAYLKNNSGHKALASYESAIKADPSNVKIKDKLEKLRKELKVR